MKETPGSSNGSYNVMQFIRAAEKFMSAGKYALALDQLRLAQRLEPRNQYIGAIIQRAEALYAGKGMESAQAASPRDQERYLTITIGNEFENGIRNAGEESLTPQETRTRVRELVQTADALLGRGQSENAFEALMKAYLLDPVAPEVIACEAKVLPVWELARRQHRVGDSRLSKKQWADLLKGKPDDHSEPEDPFATSQRRR